jgi:hypothetical protein
MLKVLLFPVALLSGAVSFASWVVRAPFKRLLDERDRERLANLVGIDGPAMADAWARVKARPWSPHEWNNIGSEWTRSDPQRAFKALAFWILLDAALMAFL